MAPPSSPDGLAIARERIAKAAVEKSGFLDLGMLGLTELPEELFRLKHLRRLNLGVGYLDAQGEWQDSITDIDEKNSPGSDLRGLGELNELQSLFLRGAVLSELVGVEGLPNLLEIDCSDTQVSDLAPLAGLSNLRWLDCSSTQVSDLSPLASLSNLQWLDCSYTRVSSLVPLVGLPNLKWLYCRPSR